MIVLGTGGHAHEIFDILSVENLTNLYFYDVYDNREIFSLFNIPVIHKEIDLKRVISSDPDFIIGTGNSNLRKKLCDKFELLGGNPVSIIANSCLIGKNNVKINPGCNIMSYALISSNVYIGKGSLVNSRVNIHHDVTIGDFCEFGPASIILGNVSIGKNVFIGSGAVILPKINIGDHAIIGAGSIVTKDVKNNSIVRGNPAKNV